VQKFKIFLHVAVNTQQSIHKSAINKAVTGTFALVVISASTFANQVNLGRTTHIISCRFSRIMMHRRELMDALSV